MSRPEPRNVRRVACVGGGTIGAGWAAYFLARGMDVTVTDPAPDGESKARRLVDDAWPSLERLGLSQGASRDRMRFCKSVADAVADAQFVQESALDREDLKIDLFVEIAQAAPADIVLSSSSSQFLPSRIASKCRNPERVIVGHPFAPSYLLPLVEVVGGAGVDPAVMDWAVDFYNGIGKHAMRLKREIEWYVANRFQKVVFAEADRLVADGICDFEDVEAAFTYGIGLRWAFAGPVMCFHMGGGKGGAKQMIAHFGWFGDKANEGRLLEAVQRMAGHLDMDAVERWRDDNLVTLMQGLKPLPRT